STRRGRTAEARRAARGLRARPGPRDTERRANSRGERGAHPQGRDGTARIRVGGSALGVGEQGARGVEIRLVDEDLAPAGCGEVLERRIDRLRIPVAALDAGRAQ